MQQAPFLEPFDKFSEWYEKAKQSEPEDPNAMALATVNKEGRPSLRMVLLKEANERGFVFYTNYQSRKGQEILATRFVALCLHWKSLRRQVRIEGEAIEVSSEEADAYFGTRDRLSQIGAWASQQSQPLESRLELEKRVALFTARYGLGKVPRPDHWSGFRVQPMRIEFWENKAFRLHDRLVYHREGDRWRTEKLYP